MTPAKETFDMVWKVSVCSTLGMRRHERGHVVGNPRAMLFPVGDGKKFSGGLKIGFQKKNRKGRKGAGPFGVGGRGWSK